MVKELIKRIMHLAVKHQLTIATAESCTAGLIAAELTSIAGSSSFFYGGIVSYSNDAKINLLGLKPQLIKKRGVVSHEVAQAMSEGLMKRNSQVNIAIATTGIAGPGGGTSEQPVGLAYLAISEDSAVNCRSYITEVWKLRFTGNRQAIQEQIVSAAMKHLEEKLIHYKE